MFARYDLDRDGKLGTMNEIASYYMNVMIKFGGEDFEMSDESDAKIEAFFIVQNRN